MRLTAAHPRVDADRGSVALERGPLVYCFEQPDQTNGVSLLDARLDATRPIAVRWEPELFGGSVRLGAAGSSGSREELDELPLYHPSTVPPTPIHAVPLRAIPYFAWANRGPAAMRVWIPTAPTISTDEQTDPFRREPGE